MLPLLEPQQGQNTYNFDTNIFAFMLSDLIILL